MRQSPEYCKGGRGVSLVVWLMMKWKLFDYRNDASLFPLFLMTESGTGGMREALGARYSAGMLSFEGGKWGYYEKLGEIDAVSRAITGRARADASFVQHAIEKTYAHGAELLALTGEVSSADLAAASNAELWGYYDAYCTANRKMRDYGWVAPAMDASGYLSGLLEETVSRRCIERGVASRKAEFMAALTFPEKDTLMRQNDLGLLRLAAEINSDARLARLFSQPEGEVLPRLTEFPAFNAALAAHVTRFEWLPCNYEGCPWDARYFVSVLQGLVRQSPSAQLAELEAGGRRSLEARVAAERELGLDEGERNLFALARELLFFKADRKDILFRSYFEVTPLLAEIAARLGLTLAQVRFMLPAELKGALLEGNVVGAGVLDERKRFSVAISEGGVTRVLLGVDARSELSQSEGHAVEFNGVLKGQCACPGKARGVVKLVLSPRDLSKMNVGDVLVANATNPDVVVAMKKAAAIVTNSGGITCHAAIVSRELGIPCVIGTKVATEVLKDGDVVEVDAGAGVVKLVSRA